MIFPNDRFMCKTVRGIIYIYNLTNILYKLYYKSKHALYTYVLDLCSTHNQMCRLYIVYVGDIDIEKDLH